MSGQRNQGFAGIVMGDKTSKLITAPQVGQRTFISPPPNPYGSNTAIAVWNHIFNLIRQTSRHIHHHQPPPLPIESAAVR